jgi:SAM-dependent methyltransferase
MKKIARLPLKALRVLFRRILLFRASTLPCGAHITRYAMYRELEGLFAQAPRTSRVLCVSDSGGLVKVLGLESANIVRADFPEHTIIDMKAFDDGSFDFVVSDQVLEHVEGDPRRAFSESFRVLKPGGVAVHTTCFMNPIHEYPVDLWRFTPYALRYLASDFPKIVKVGGWGNRGVWVAEWLGLRFTPIPHATWHPLHKLATRNNKLWPVSTWIVAQKADGDG